MEYVIVCTVALFASGLTLFSGFGLGTILMPALAVFFPVPVAIGATAVVHLANNLFKIFLVGHFVNKNILIRFGVPAVIAALLGAILLNTVSAFPAIASYQLGGRLHEITLVKLAIGLIIVLFYSDLNMSPGWRFVGYANWLILAATIRSFSVTPPSACVYKTTLKFLYPVKCRSG